MEHVYWNPTMETMPREQLRALQDAAALAAENSEQS